MSACQPAHRVVGNRFAPVLLEGLECRRLLSAGDLDPTFGAGGIILLPTQRTPTTVVLEPDGKVVTLDNGGIPSSIDRFNADGTPDLTFGEHGEVREYFHVLQVAVAPDGKLVLAGSENFYPSHGPAEWHVARLNADGTPDASFNGTDPNTSAAKAFRVVPAGSTGVRGTLGWLAVQPNGKIIVGGATDVGHAPGFDNPIYPSPDYTETDLVRFNTDGSLDTTFGTGGEALSQDHYSPNGGQLLFTGDGNIIASGTRGSAYGSGPAADVFDASGRYLYAGALGPTYGFSSAIVTGTITTDGTAVFAVSRTLVSGNPYSLERLDGTQKDFAFNTPNGTPALPEGSALFPIVGGDLKLAAEADDKVVVAAGGTYGGNSIAIARFNNDGTPDLSFGTGGTSVITLNPFHDRWAGAESVQAIYTLADGNFLVVGTLRGQGYVARVLGGSHATLHAQPTAGVVSDGVYNRGTDPAMPNVQVRYVGARAIDTATLDDHDILVTGPNGYSAVGKLMYPEDVAGSLTPLLVTYQFPSPGDGPAGYGHYTVHVVDHQVADTSGNAVAAGVVGSFDLPYADFERNNLPRGQQFTAAVIAPYGLAEADQYMTFRVRFEAYSSVDLTTLRDGNFSVTGSRGGQQQSQFDIKTDALFVGAEASPDGKIVVATYRVPPHESASWKTVNGYALTYRIATQISPQDKNGNALNATITGSFVIPQNQPSATLVDVSPSAEGAVAFRVRYSPRPPTIGNVPAGFDLSSLSDHAVSVDALDAASSDDYFSSWATLVRAEVGNDNSVLVTYAAPALAAGQTYAIHIPATTYDQQTHTQQVPHTKDGTAVPTGFLGAFDTTYATRPPAASLVTAAVTPSHRRSLTFAVRYDTLAGLDAATLGDTDLRVSGPRGFRANAQLVGYKPDLDGTSGIATYAVRLPRGRTGGAANGVYGVQLRRRQVYDAGGRLVPAGVLGTFVVAVPAPQAIPLRPVPEAVFQTTRRIGHEEAW